MYQYQVAISYARENGDYVSQVVSHLRDRKVYLFFDRSEEIDLWGKDLYAELAEVYTNKAWCCVMFLSEWYARKMWTNYERQVIQKRGISTNCDFILPVKLDQADIPGFPPGVVYVDAMHMEPSKLAQVIMEKVRLLERSQVTASVRDEPTLDEGSGFGRFKLANIYEPYWFGGGAYAMTRDGRRIRLAEMTSGLEGLTHFKGTSCALLFDMETSIRAEWVRVDEIWVRVNQWRKLPKYRPLLPRPYESSHVYYAEIDNRCAVYRADYLIRSERVDVAFVRLFKGRPERFVVRVNARTPGIYNFNIELLCSTADQQTLVPVAKNQEFIFDKLDES